MKSNVYVALILLFLVVIPVLFWLSPSEINNTNEQVTGKVLQYFSSSTHKGTPKPYFRIEINNNVVVNVEDYGTVKAKPGERVLLQKNIGNITGRDQYNLVRKL